MVLFPVKEKEVPQSKWLKNVSAFMSKLNLQSGKLWGMKEPEETRCFYEYFSNDEELFATKMTVSALETEWRGKAEHKVIEWNKDHQRKRNEKERISQIFSDQLHLTNPGVEVGFMMDGRVDQGKYLCHESDATSLGRDLTSLEPEFHSSIISNEIGSSKSLLSVNEGVQKKINNSFDLQNGPKDGYLSEREKQRTYSSDYTVSSSSLPRKKTYLSTLERKNSTTIKSSPSKRRMPGASFIDLSEASIIRRGSLLDRSSRIQRTHSRKEYRNENSPPSLSGAYSGDETNPSLRIATMPLRKPIIHKPDHDEIKWYATLPKPSKNRTMLHNDVEFLRIDVSASDLDSSIQKIRSEFSKRKDRKEQSSVNLTQSNNFNDKYCSDDDDIPLAFLRRKW